MKQYVYEVGFLRKDPDKGLIYKWTIYTVIGMVRRFEKSGEALSPKSANEKAMAYINREKELNDKHVSVSSG